MATDPKQLQEHAVQAEKHLEALATGLAEVDAPENVTKTVTQMAEVARKVVTALGDARDATPPPEEAEEPAEVPPEAAPPEQPRTIGGAAKELHAEVAQRAQARRVP